MAHSDYRYRLVCPLYPDDYFPRPRPFVINIGPVARPRFTNKLVLFLAATAAALLSIYLFWSFESSVKALLEQRMGADPSPSPETIIGVVKLILIGIAGYLFVRALNFLFFGLAFRLKRIDALTLFRNILPSLTYSI